MLSQPPGDLGGKTGAFGAKNEHIIRAKTFVTVRSRGKARQCKQASALSSPHERSPVRKLFQFQQVPVIQTRPPDRSFIHGKRRLPDDRKTAARADTQAGNVARIGRNFGLHERNFHGGRIDRGRWAAKAKSPGSAKSLAPAGRADDLRTMLEAEVHEILDAARLPTDVRIEPVRREASARHYLRLRFLNPDSSFKTLILCSGLERPYRDQDHFVEIARFLQAHEIPVPRVVAVAEELGAILLSDGGIEDLSGALREARETDQPVRFKRLLQRAIDQIQKMQKLAPPAAVGRRLFDSEKLNSEMEFLFSNLNACCVGLGARPPITFEFSIFVQELCETLGRSGPFVFTHRDYHGRNILLRGDPETPDLTIIDFQDARMGLPWYDLASLLYDPYSRITHADRQEALEYFLERASPQLKKQRGYFYAVAMQRLLKALGTYIHQVFVREHHAYLDSIPPTLERLEEVIQLAHFPDSAYLLVSTLRGSLIPALRHWVERKEEARLSHI